MKEEIGGKMRGAGGAGRPRSISGDPSIPRWLCQMCRHPLSIAGADAYAEKLSTDQLRSGGQTSVHGTGSIFTGRMDNSFVVLPKQRNHPSGLPPARPRTISNHPPPLTVAGIASQPGQSILSGSEKAFSGTSGTLGSNTGESYGGRTMDESFVVLPSAAASMYRYEASGDGSAACPSGSGGTVINALHTNNASFNASVNVLTRVFELASAQTKVEQPLCLECMRALSEELDKQVEEVTRDIKAYEACIDRLKKEQFDAVSEEDFAKEKIKIEEEENQLKNEISEVELQNEEVLAQLQELELKSEHFKELEERYWHDCNDFRLQLICHQEDRDAVLSKIEVLQEQLEMLKSRNVLNDAFHISHDGEFGTINNFRLGRLPNVPVEWDEINAAWGQACLLLCTMAQYCRLNFSYRILPMGSFPRIADNKNTYELFGPVNLFWSTRYDKAMVFFLACLKEFSDFANAKDKASNLPPEKCFQLPYKIENDKVEGYTITQSFNRQEKWTKALKYTLCDLKWALYWLIGNTSFQPAASPSASMASSGLSQPPMHLQADRKLV